MTIGEIIAIIVALVIVGLAILYIIRAKKSGQKCIGCPYSKTCGSDKCGCSCSKESKNKEESKG